MKIGMCMCAVRLGGLPIQCPGKAKSLATPLNMNSTTAHNKVRNITLILMALI